jgi:cytochrome P450
MAELDSLTLDDAFMQSPHDVLRREREEAPARRVRFASGHEGWLVTRYDDVKALTADPRVSRDLDRIHAAQQASAAEGTPDQPADGVPEEYAWMFRDVLYMDPPDHTRLRKLVNKAFTPRAIDRLRPRIEQITDDLLDRMAGAGAVDLMTSFAVPLPVTAISELLGVPAADRPDFWAWSDVLNGDGVPGAERVATLRASAGYLDSLADRKKAAPGADLMSHMVTASEDGDQLSRQELIAMALLMLLAGHDTTANLIANGTLAFLRSPGQLALLHADPALLPNAVEEILRYDCPINISPERVTVEPVKLPSGVTIPAGELVYLSLLSANRDARQFENPDTFDITRDTAGHLGFLHGIHFCLGAPLARLEGNIALGKLFGRFPRLRLAVPPESLTYRTSTLMHGPTSLPVHLDQGNHLRLSQPL